MVTSKHSNFLITFLVYSITLFSCITFAQEKYSEQNLQSDITSILHSPLFENTLASIKIISLSDKKILFDHNTKLFLRPASNSKLFTTAAALSILDSTYTFRTEVYGVNRDTNSGSWNIFIRGGADPLFSAKDIQKLVENISHRSITQIDSLFLDCSIVDSNYYGKGWMWDDESEAFQPYLSAFSIEHNTMKVNVTASQQSINTTLSPDWIFFPIINTAIIGSKDSIIIKRLHHSNSISISGTLIKGHSYSTELSIWDTPAIVAKLFYKSCDNYHIKHSNIVSVCNSIPSDAASLTSSSHTLTDVLQYMNKKSDNLSAELLLKIISYNVSKNPGSTHHGLQLMKQTLAKIKVDTSVVAMVDGSGNSFYNLTTVEAVTTLLEQMWYSKHQQSFIKTLAVGSTDGTMKNRLTGNNYGKYVYAKTGTLQGVSNLSGYFLPPNGIPVCFSIFMQNFVGEPKPYRHVQDEIISRIIRFSVANYQSTHSR